jgi:hypothetical protein
MIFVKDTFRIAAIMMFAGTMSTGVISSAHAQNAAGMSCDALWYARNAIYARNGYCFKTDRGRAAFGAGCFPPYGAVSGGEQNRVNELQYWERQRGC